MQYWIMQWRRVHIDEWFAIRLQPFDQLMLLFFQNWRQLSWYRLKTDTVSGSELADFPQFSLNNGNWADKSPQTGPIRAEDDRHVAGKIDFTDGIGVVVDIGRVQAGFAAITPRPLGFRADEPHAGAAGVVVHFPLGRKKLRNIGLGEKIRSAVRSIQHGDFPMVGITGDQLLG